MDNIYILCFHPIFSENAFILSKRSNIPYIQGDYKPKQNDFLIVFGAHQHPHVFLQMIENFHIKMVMIQTEQLNSAVFENKYYIRLMKHPFVFVYDWSKYNANKLKRDYDVTVRSIYSYDFFGKDPYPPLNERPIDIFFCGAKNETRQDIINKLKNKYPHYKFFVDFDYNLTNQNKLCEILKKCKVVLNIPFYDSSVLETHRIIQAKSCGCEVLTKYSNCDELNEAYEDYVHFSNNFIKSLEDINYFIEHPKKGHQEWNDKINSHSLSHNIEQLKNIISIFYKQKEDEKK